MVHHAGTGYWVAPGGKTDECETPLQCCEREAQEGRPVHPRYAVPSSMSPTVP
ncbi:NUDIX domain-containing protein [Streptomyces sp. NPDC050161]|uniref:NUDIX domain-containing protein n=1 Tax=Streptomyces sp. NPDC050161 TaxID=3365604 RepID=UPI0037B2C6C0